VVAKFSMVGPRDYTRTTLRRLDSLAGNQCSAPDCTKPLMAKDGISIISKICHIEAASKEGPRWNLNMTDDERRGFDNLILLCDECHTIIDNKENESEYPAPLLKQWKKDHEERRTYKLLNERPSLLSTVIGAVADIDLGSEETVVSGDVKAFEIEAKLDYNHIKRHRALIDEYKVFYTKVNSLYQTLEREGSFKKDNLLRNVRQVYLQVMGAYVGDSTSPMDLIQKNSDAIFDEVVETLTDKATEKYEGYEEDISFGVPIVAVDAFIRCKILEEPAP